LFLRCCGKGVFKGMEYARFWLVRHAVVDARARTMLYGRMDVGLCADSVGVQRARYQALAARLPARAPLVITPLRRTRETAEALWRAGYKAADPVIEPDLTEQDLGEWQGLAHADLPARLVDPAHPFWPLGAAELPPGGESMEQVVDRVGKAMDRLAWRYRGQDVAIISHGGAIRAAVAHALGIGAAAALHFSVQNLSLTILERLDAGWRVVAVNEGAEILG
jgi:broad specificity phosphatase PhoE